ncbi:NitT/TauT family transport system substrate-binding protein [Thiogranum longum]|uniref:NitT/TauT family transport system substrate-binding protein n=1 Tax=Thiogranum longum TaxID=1537524 RepID=A0A4R1HGR7_9GAMM|nr:ABC transporter substrate-binding protein [Thiogranum longum]TCK18539.1 NitT/TauT family transport system substrate-binding protein [Thiogranum longum]
MFIRYFCIAALLLVSGGCSRPMEEPLRVGSNIWPGYESLYLARSLDLFPKQTIHLAELPSATTVMQAISAGSLDAACLTLDEVLTARSRAVDLQVLLVMDVSAGGDVILARPPIRSLGQLRGKTIAVENTAVGAILLDGALRAAGLQPEDVTLEFAGVDEHESIYQSGKVDAVVTFEPVRSHLLAQGAVPLFDSRQIPNRIIDVLVVRAEAIEKYESQLHDLVRGHFSALAYRRDHPDDADRRMAPLYGVEPEQMKTLFEGLKIPGLAENRHLLGGSPPALEATARALTEVMNRAGLLRDEVEISGMFQPRFLPAGSL